MIDLSEITEVRNEGFLGANFLLAQGWLLLDWMAEHRNRRRSPGWPEEPVLYILRRPSAVLFTSEDVEAAAESGAALAATARGTAAVMEADRKHR